MKPAVSRNRWSLALCLLSLAASSWAASRVEIRQGQFFVDGQPFYVRGVGYSSLRPHQKPGGSYSGTNFDWIAKDFERIRAAHFNTLRTWEPLAPQELELAKKNGLMVLQGIRLDPRQDFSDSQNQSICIDQAQSIARQSKDYDNVLGYLMITRPWPSAVMDSDPQKTMQFLRRLKRAIQEVDPRPVSMESWLPLAFLDHSDFDFVSFDAYEFWPKAITDSLGFANYVRWMADRFGAGRPFIIGETGGYAVSQASVTASGGSGGLQEDEQSLKDIRNLRGIVQGHADGSVLMSWIDAWYNPRDPDTHDNEPWEWDGILGIPTDSAKDMEGIPRQIYGDVSRFNEAILLEPKTDHIYSLTDPLAIEVYAADNVTSVRYSLNGADWIPLNSLEGGWYKAFLSLPKLARHRQKLAIQALDASNTEVSKSEASFLVAVLPEHLEILSSGSPGPPGLPTFTAKISDDHKLPIPNRKIIYGFFYPISLREAQSTALTDIHGEVHLSCPLPPTKGDRFLYVAAGTDSPDRVRTSDMRIFKLGS